VESFILKHLKDSKGTSSKKSTLDVEHCSSRTKYNIKKYRFSKALFSLPAVTESGKLLLGFSNINNSTKIRQHSKALLGMYIGTRISRLTKKRVSKNLVGLSLKENIGI
jgi:hypothetical protein